MSNPGGIIAGSGGGGLFSGFTRLSKLLVTSMALGFLICLLFPEAEDYLCLVPGRTIPWVSMLVTSGFTELNPWALVAEVAAVLLLTKSIEPVYGSKEFMRFVSVVVVSTATATLAVMYILYVATLDVNHIYESFYGAHGLVGGLLVAVKHIMPDHEIVLFGTLKFRAKYTPSIYLLLLTAIAFIPTVDEEQLLPFAYFGAYSAWLYLRYLQPKPDGAAAGDASDGFAFATFFPPFMQGPVDKVATVCAFAFRLRGGRGAPPAAAPLVPTASNDPEAQRRRERGAKALEERLAGAARDAGREGPTADVEIGPASPAPPQI